MDQLAEFGRKFKDLFSGKVSEPTPQKGKEKSGLPNGFAINPEADTKAKSEVLNLGATTREGHPANPIYLVEPDETIVKLTGTPEDLISLTTRAQEKPVKPVDTQPTDSKTVDGDIVTLKRTGVHIIRDFFPSERATYLQPTEPSKARIRQEIVGIFQLHDGSYQVFLLPGETHTIVLHTMADTPKHQAEHEKEMLIQLLLKRNSMNILDFALIHPLVSDEEKRLIAEARASGAIIRKGTRSYSTGPGGHSFPGTNNRETIVLDNRSPQDDDSLIVSHPFPLPVIFAETKNFADYFQEVVLPSNITGS